jgi:hypothetical protein
MREQSRSLVEETQVYFVGDIEPIKCSPAYGSMAAIGIKM